MSSRGRRTGRLSAGFVAAAFLALLAGARGARAEGQRYTVLIGIGSYADARIPPLAFAASDARSVADLVAAPESGGLPAHTKVLTDAEATKKSILSALGTWLPRLAGPEDTVIIYYAGHGAPEIDPTGRAPDGHTKYLVPYDADPSDLFATAIPMKDIEEIFERIEAERVVLVLDTCYSGAAGGRTFYTGPPGRALNITGEFIDRLVQGKGRMVLTSADANEVALELPELGHGLFTYHFLEAVRGAADRNLDGQVTIDEAYPYVYERVSEASRGLGGSQHPVLAGSVTGTLTLAMTQAEGITGLRSGTSTEPLARIEVEVNTPGVEVSLDGRKAWVSTPVERRHELIVPGGSYRLLARGPTGAQEYTRSVKVDAGQTRSFMFAFERTPDVRTRRAGWWGRALVGVGAVGAVSSAGYVAFGYFQVGQRDILTQSEARAAREDFSKIRTWGAAGGAVAGAVIGTGAVLWWRSSSSQASPLSVGFLPPGGGTGPWSASLAFRF